MSSNFPSSLDNFSTSLAAGQIHTSTLQNNLNDAVNKIEGFVLNSRLFNVKDYGAVCNGTTDDTTAQDAAITAMRASGGVVYFPGFSKRTTKLQVQTGDRFAGAGYRVSGINFTLTGAAIEPANTAAFTDFGSFEDMALTGDSTNSTIGFFGKSCREWLFREVEMNGFTQNCVNLYGQRNADGTIGGSNPGDATYNRFFQLRALSGTNPIKLTGTAGTARIDGGTANMNVFVGGRAASATAQGLFIDQGTSNVFVRFSFGPSTNDGVLIKWYSNFFLGCVSENNGGWGFNLSSDAECHDNVIFGLHDGGSNTSGLIQDQSGDNDWWTYRHGIHLSKNSGGTSSVQNNSLFNTTSGLRWKDDGGTTVAPELRLTTVPTVASAGTLGLTQYARVQKISGTTTVTSITATGWTGMAVTLVFTSTAQLTDGGNLKLSANFTGGADRAITLVCDGTNWFETARSTN